MGSRRALLRAWMAAVAAVLVACGGGGGGGSPAPSPPPPPPPVADSIPIISGTALASDVQWQPPAGATPASGNYIYLESEAGDPIGQGRTELFTQAESSLAYSPAGGGSFALDFQAANAQRQWAGEFFYLLEGNLQPGFYGNAQWPTSADHDRPVGLIWSTEGRQCKVFDGWFVIDASNVAEVDIRFRLRCDGSTGALRGKLHYDPHLARPGPITDIPPDLWQPAAGAVPAQGSYLYLESDPGDYVGQGRTYLYTRENSRQNVELYVNDFGSIYRFWAVSGTQTWAGDFIGIYGVALARGYYPGVQKFPYAADGIGAMEWTSGRQGCGRVIGWYAVDEITYVGDVITQLVLRFEQRCDLSSARLRGKIRYVASEWQPSNARVDPPPGGLWQPPAGSTPDSGDYVYLQSDAGDSVGQGRTVLYTGANASLQGVPFDDSFHVTVGGDAVWQGDFRAMSAQKLLATGYYGGLVKAAAPIPDSGGLAWSADGRACSVLDGWVVIDSIHRDPAGAVTDLDLRFEQHCAGDAGALHGKLRWSMPATSQPVPVPESLWRPDPASLPPSGNYLYLESDWDNEFLAGTTVLITDDDTVNLAGGSTGPGASVQISTVDSYSLVFARFNAPPALTQLVPGLYGNLLHTEPNVRGSLQFAGFGFACGVESGWFAVDDVTYVGGYISTIDLRFEQHCDGSPSALRGKLHLDGISQGRPHLPTAIPGGLWQPAPGATPDGGNFAYFESGYGDDMGQGQVSLYTPDNSTMAPVGGTGNSFGVSLIDLAGTELFWTGQFAAMDALPHLQVGYYDAVPKLRNPLFAQMAWQKWGGLALCNDSLGWLAIDSLTYSGDTITSIDFRFEEHCNRNSAPLHGRVRWTAP